MWLLLLLAVPGLCKDTADSPYHLVKKITSCPDVGYFYQLQRSRAASNELTRSLCYLCFCQEAGTAACVRRNIKKCKGRRYHYIDKRDLGVSRAPYYESSSPPGQLRNYPNATRKKYESKISQAKNMTEMITNTDAKKVRRVMRKSRHVTTALSKPYFEWNENTRKEVILNKTISLLNTSNVSRTKIIKKSTNENINLSQKVHKNISIFKTKRNIKNGNAVKRNLNKFDGNKNLQIDNASKGTVTKISQIKTKADRINKGIINIKGRIKRDVATFNGIVSDNEVNYIIGNDKIELASTDILKTSTPNKIKLTHRKNADQHMRRNCLEDVNVNTNHLRVIPNEAIYKNTYNVTEENIETNTIETVVLTNQEYKKRTTNSNLEKENNSSKKTKHRNFILSQNEIFNKTQSEIISTTQLSFRSSSDLLDSETKIMKIHNQLYEQKLDTQESASIKPNFTRDSEKQLNINKAENQTVHKKFTQTVLNKVNSIANFVKGIIAKKKIKPQCNNKNKTNNLKSKQEEYEDITKKSSKKPFLTKEFGHHFHLMQTSVLESSKNNYTSKFESNRNINNIGTHLFNLLNTLIKKDKHSSNIISINKKLKKEDPTFEEAILNHFQVNSLDYNNNFKLMCDFQKFKQQSKAILKRIKVIKKILHFVNFFNSTELSEITEPNKVKAVDDIKKLNAILKGYYANDNNSRSLPKTQLILIEFVKNNMNILRKSLVTFANLFYNMMHMLETHKTNKRNKLSHALKYVKKEKHIYRSKGPNVTQESIKSLKTLLSQYNVIQNLFFKKILRITDDFESNLRLKNDNRQEKLQTSIKFNDYLIKLNNKTTDMMNNLKNIKDNSKKNSRRRRSKRYLVKDDDSLDYLLIIMEYLIKQSVRSNSDSDGIDLLIEAIKNSPDQSVNKYNHRNFPEPANRISVNTKSHTTDSSLGHRVLQDQSNKINRYLTVDDSSFSNTTKEYLIKKYYDNDMPYKFEISENRQDKFTETPNPNAKGSTIRNSFTNSITNTSDSNKENQVPSLDEYDFTWDLTKAKYNKSHKENTIILNSYKGPTEVSDANKIVLATKLYKNNLINTNLEENLVSQKEYSNNVVSENILLSYQNITNETLTAKDLKNETDDRVKTGWVINCEDDIIEGANDKKVSTTTMGSTMKIVISENDIANEIDIEDENYTTELDIDQIIHKNDSEFLNTLDTENEIV